LGRIEAALQRMRISWAYTGRREYIDQWHRSGWCTIRPLNGPNYYLGMNKRLGRLLTEPVIPSEIGSFWRLGTLFKCIIASQLQFDDCREVESHVMMMYKSSKIHNPFSWSS
jgi:hypothetical protein